jgi:catechol 2,3-dioxygenase-like lactoylglutathione lyase family enzyme
MESSALQDSVVALTDLFGFERVAQGEGSVTLKHPNTAWLLVVNDGGPDAPPKQFHHHWGMRVLTNAEVQNSYQYLLDHSNEYGLGEVTDPEHSHGSMSVYLQEPGGNFWEVECFEDLLRNPKAGGGERLSGVRAPHWTSPLTDDDFPGHGYVPQGFTHGTLASGSIETAERFYGEVLGLEVVRAYKNVRYVKHPAEKHYVVCLERPSEQDYSPRFRNTLAVASPQDVEESHAWLRANQSEFGIRDLRAIEQQGDIVSFLLLDPDRNWWEIAAPVSQ